MEAEFLQGIAILRTPQEGNKGEGTACVGDTGVDTRVGAGQAARPHSYVSDARKAYASLGDTVTTVSVIPTGPGAAGVISPNFFLFVTTIGVIVS